MIHPYGLLITIAIFLGFKYFQRHTHLSEKLQEDLFLGLFLVSLFGARLYHVLDYWSYYSQNLAQSFAVWQGGLGIFGAIIAGFIYLLIFCKKYHLSIQKLLTQIATPLALIQSMGRWGNFFNHEVYGSRGEPVWLYESIGCFLLFLFLHFHKKNQLSFYLIGYGLLRFFLEFLRTDTWQISNLKIAQLISLVFIAIGICLKLKRRLED
jgi:phosphatidylglycerol:prolipoprotein diacylglycerol transferase